MRIVLGEVEKVHGRLYIPNIGIIEFNSNDSKEKIFKYLDLIKEILNEKGTDF